MFERASPSIRILGPALLLAAAAAALTAPQAALARSDPNGVATATKADNALLAAHSARLGRLGAAIVERERRLAESRKTLRIRRRAASAAQIRLAGARAKLRQLALAAQRIAQEPTPAILLHPDRPLDAARSAMLLRRLSKKLAAQRRLERDAAESVAAELSAAERAEAALLADLRALRKEEAEVARLQKSMQAAARAAQAAEADAARARAASVRRESQSASALALALSNPELRPAAPIKLRRRFPPEMLRDSRRDAEPEPEPQPEPPLEAQQSEPEAEPQEQAIAEAERAAPDTAPEQEAAPHAESAVAQGPEPEPDASPAPLAAATPAPKPLLAPAPKSIAAADPEDEVDLATAPPAGAPRPGPPALPPPPDIPEGLTFAKARGMLLWPAAGDMRRSQRKSEPGVSVFTAPYARVIAPWRGKVVYTGEFKSEGRIVIIEPQKGYSILMTGLESLDVAVGQSLAAGEPIGRMGGPAGWSDEFLFEEHPDAMRRSERLYMEISRNRRHLDPAPWFRSATERVSGL